MNIQLLFNGDLEISISNQRELKRLKKQFKTDCQSFEAETEFIQSYLEPLGYSETTPAQHSCLTDAPMITNGSDIWGYMDYQIHSFIQELLAGNKIIWQKG